MMKTAFQRAAENYDLPKLQELYTERTTRRELLDAYGWAFFYGQRKMAAQIKVWMPDVEQQYPWNRHFTELCRSPIIKMAKKLLVWKPDLDMSYNNEEAFRAACEKVLETKNISFREQRLEMIEWLVCLRFQKLIPLVLRSERLTQDDKVRIIRPYMAGIKIAWFINNQRWNPNCQVGREYYKKFIEKTGGP